MKKNLIVVLVALLLLGGVEYMALKNKSVPNVQTQDSVVTVNSDIPVIGQITLDPNMVAEEQQSVDAGHQPWRLDSEMVAQQSLGEIGDDAETKKVSLDFKTGIAIYNITLNGQVYEVTAIQPVVGKNKVWFVSDIEYVNDGTTGLKTYTNSQYGFRFKYPENLHINETGAMVNTSGTQASDLGTVTLEDSATTNLLSVEIFDPSVVEGDYGWHGDRPCGEWTFGPDGKALSSEQTTFAGEKTLHVVSSLFGSGTNNYNGEFYCVKSTNPVVISYDQANENQVQEILSTFNFTK